MYLFCLEVKNWYATYPDLNLQLCARDTPGSCTVVGLGSKCMKIRLSSWKIVVEICVSRSCCHMGKVQRAGTFVSRKILPIHKFYYC